MDDTPSQRIAASVRAELARRRVTQQALALALGRSQAAISRRVTGAVPWSADELVAVARHLDLPLPSLLADADRPEQPAAVGAA